MLINFSKMVTGYIEKTSKRSDLNETAKDLMVCLAAAADGEEWRNGSERTDDQVAEAVDGLVALQNTQTELRLIPAFRDAAKGACVSRV
jgi:hypothetical protein